MNKNKKLNHVYCGIDCHKKSHSATVIDCFMEKLGSITVGNNALEFDKLIEFVNTFETDGMTAIWALEDINGLGRKLAQYLISKGKDIRFVNSTLSSKEAKKQTTLHKSDTYDSFCVAKVLLEKLDTLPASSVKDDTYYMINQLATRRHKIVRDIIALVNQLHAQLSYNYTEYNLFFCSIDTASGLDLWEKYPSADKLQGVTMEELTDIFLKHTFKRTHSLKKAEFILENVRKNGDIDRKGLEMRDFLIKTYVNDIKFLTNEKNEIDKKLKELVKSLDLKITTLLGVDFVTASQLIAEIGDIKKFGSAAKLARYSGCSPVEYSSGQKTKHFIDRRGNRKLNSIIFRITLNHIRTYAHSKEPVNPKMYEYYNKKIKEGKTRMQAIACVKRKLVDIIYNMLKYNREYWKN